MEIRNLLYGLVVFLVSAVSLTLLGIGGAAGNTTGLLFWILLIVLGVAFVLSRTHSGDEDAVRLARKPTKDRDRG